MHFYVTSIITDILMTIVFLVGAYYLATAFFSFLPQNKIAKQPEVGRFSVVIPARNEGEVILSLIQSIRNADYPQHLITILVVADGCSDRTGEIAKRYADLVLTRSVSTCKGDALADAFNYLDKVGVGADFVAVFDADNVVDARFFKEINEEFALGAKAVQGYIDSKNPNASWVSNAHSMWYWITNRTVQLGRAKLGMGCRIGGTGFAIRREILSQVPWRTNTLAEDAEYTCILAEKGIKVTFAERAVVYDEKPVSFTESVGQRRRWARGVCDVQAEYTFKLLRKGNFNAVLGLWCDVLNPLIFILMIVVGIFKVGGIASSLVGGTVIWIYIATNILAVIISLNIDNKINFRNFLNIFGIFLYFISWIPIGIIGLVCRTDGWYHSRHGK